MKKINVDKMLKDVGHKTKEKPKRKKKVEIKLKNRYID